MYHLRIEATPRADCPKVAEFGGAFVNCWIDDSVSDGEKAALARATSTLLGCGWEVRRVSECGRLEREEQSESGLEYFEQAIQDGECYVFHTWPPGSEEDCDGSDGALEVEEPR